eukprot:Nitzschia sp. Nitz4//scaffold131_size63436//11727//12455//NITZ4_006265-RA/size63436-processed-gene-0.95-mRNA-1//1//CDS//3329535238//4044//frame0
MFSNVGSMMQLSDEVTEYLGQGTQLATLTLALTLVLEIWSFDTVQKILKQKGAGYKLYTEAVVANIRNHFGFGVPIYTLSAAWCCCPQGHLHWLQQVRCFFAILWVHSLCFYSLHRAFHEYPSLYRHHRFHHRFNVYVSPMAANAVSSVEYIFAYIVPFAIAMAIVRPDGKSTQMSVAAVAVTNIFLHTPKVESFMDEYIPKWWVTTGDHLEHHRKLNTKYAAPTFNIDFFVNFLEASVAKD